MLDSSIIIKSVLSDFHFIKRPIKKKAISVVTHAVI
jgi:hypothetical protein